LRLKRIEVASIANKLRNGLFKIDSTSKKVAGMTIELEKATETVTKYTTECDEFLDIITEQTSIADKKKKEVDEQSITIKHEEIESQELYSIAIADLEKAMPALEEAMEVIIVFNIKMNTKLFQNIIHIIIGVECTQ
jgi:dynein heavy chain